MQKTTLLQLLKMQYIHMDYAIIKYVETKLSS